MKIKVYIALFFACAALFACKKDDNNSTSNLPISEQFNVAYGTDAAQNMDIYLPANRTDTGTKAIVLIHGGSWIAGDKSDFNSNITNIKINLPNYAIFNLNYRLAAPPSSNLWPTQINDINTAFDFIISNAATYHFNINKIAVLGASAGAQLALLKAYKYNTNNNIKAVVDYFGPTNMANLYYFQDASTQSLFALFMGGTPSTNATAYSNASPLQFVTSTSPATIMFHGTADNVVPYQQSVALDSALQANGRVHLYKQYTGEPHGNFSATAALDSYNSSITFLQANNP